MRYYSDLTKKLYETQEEVIAAELAVKEAEAKKADATKKKKADAEKVELAFKALNAARKTYRENTAALTKKYSEEIAALKKAFAEQREKEEAALAKAENVYSVALKEFTSKHPEGYHLTLKDGDFETTISSDRKSLTGFDSMLSIFDWLFR